MEKSKALTILIFLLISTAIFGQQPQVYNQFFMNPYVYNPSYAGVEGHAAFFVTYHDQWVNLQGGPAISHMSFHVPFRGGIALGAAAFNVQQGLVNTSAAKITGAYLLNIDRTHFVRFGMSLGAGLNSVNISDFDANSANDPAFQNFLDQSSFMIGDVGATYHFGHFNIGVSLPNLFNYNSVSQTEIAALEFSPTDFIFFKANYRGHITDDFAIEPHILYRYSNILPSQFEATLITHIKHLVWVGAGYRQDAGITAVLGAKIKEKIGLGVAYEMGNSNISSLLGPSFELSIGYHLGTKKEHAEHVSSFIKSHRLSAEERARKATELREKRIADAMRLNEAKPEKTIPDESSENSDNSTPPVNSYENDPIESSEIENKEVIPTAIVTQEGDPQENENEQLSKATLDNANNAKEEKGTFEDNPIETPPVISSKETNEPQKINVDYAKMNELDKAYNTDSPTPINTNDSPSRNQVVEKPATLPDLNNQDTPSRNKTVSVRKGNHMLELPVGNFVIGGSFQEFDHAEEYSDELFQDGYYDARVGYSSERGYYYVVIYQSDDVDAARKTRDRFRRQPKLKNAWVLQVTE